MKSRRAFRIAVGLAGTSCAAMFRQAKQDVDLLVSGGIVVTMDGTRPILHDGSIAIKGAPGNRDGNRIFHL